MGYHVHAPIAQSGYKCMLNKVYVQVSKYVIMAFLSNNTGILSFVRTGYEFVLPCMPFMHLALFRPLNARPCMAQLEARPKCCMGLENHIPDSDVIFM